MNSPPQPSSARGKVGDELAEIGVIAVTGTDASDFLQTQLSNDVAALGHDESMLAAWCDAKGRVLALPRVVRCAEAFLLLLPPQLVAPVLRRLRLFVLRSRVALEDAGNRWRAYGTFRESDPQPEANAVIRHGDRQYLGLPGPQPRHVVLLPARDQPDDPATDSAWRRADILAGLPVIYPETQGLFVPQMLNLHWLDGIAFDKGCYPGQEVVARLQYRGRLTRRLFRGILDTQATPPPGTPVTDTEGSNQGQVVDATPGPDGQDLLAVLRVGAADGLQIAGADLETAPLPYRTE